MQSYPLNAMPPNYQAPQSGPSPYVPPSGAPTEGGSSSDAPAF
jgi:hypothetical protein